MQAQACRVRAAGTEENKYWYEHLVSPETRQVADKIRQEVLDPITGKLDPSQPKKWVDIQLSNPDGSHRIQHSIDVQDWTGPQPKPSPPTQHSQADMPSIAMAQAPRYPTDPGHPLYNSYRQIRDGIAASGQWQDERLMDNLAAGALKRLVTDGGVDRIEDVRTQPHGVAVICKSDLQQRISRTETHLCYASVAKSGQTPAEQHFHEIAQSQHEQHQQLTQAQHPSGPVMRM
ncbi:MAG: hypothetical protein Q4G70_03730 [Pseudomonadota bacterium]|nr:hypothetical protein [Pseudomonadota bacterium]